MAIQTRPLRSYKVSPSTEPYHNSRIVNETGKVIYKTEIHNHSLSKPGLTLHVGDADTKVSMAVGAVTFPSLSKNLKLGLGDPTSANCVWDDLHPSKTGYDFYLTIPNTQLRQQFFWKSLADGGYELVDTQNVLLARVSRQESWLSECSVEIVEDLGGNLGDLVVILTALGIIEKNRRK